MPHRAARLILSCLLVVCVHEARAGVFPDDPFSDKASGTTGAAFLKIPAGARAQALGTAFAAAAEGTDAIFWNPAGLARQDESGDSELGFSYNVLLETAYSGTLAYVRPLPDRLGVLGAAFVYFSQSSIQGYDRFGEPSGKFTPNDLALSLSYARKLQAVSLGSSVKFIRSEVAGVSGTSFAFDIGIQAERITDVGEGALDFGASMRNLGPPIQTGSVADPLPFEFQTGVMWHVSPNVRFLLDGHLPVDHDPYPSLGLEGRFRVTEEAQVFPRAGIHFRDHDDIDGLTGLGAGVGLDLRRFRFDYAWVLFGDLGNTHRISAAFRF